MKVGDRVMMINMWKYDKAVGTILKVTADYIVVKWDDIPGRWHYTVQQAQKLEVINEDR